MLNRTIFVVLAFISIVFLIYQPAYLDYARRDHINFIIERNQFKSDWSWFTHSINYNRTRLTNQGDYLLFRPGFFFFLTLEDIFLRDNQLVTGVLSITLHLLVALFLYALFKLYFKGILAFALAALFASQYAGIEMVTWRHISFYMLSIIFSLTGLFIFLSKIRYKYFIGGLVFLGAMVFQEIIPASAILLMTMLALTLPFRTQHRVQENINISKLIYTLGSAVIIYFALDVINWMVLRPPQILNTGDHFSFSVATLNESIQNFLHYLGAGTRAVFDPFSIVMTWKKSDADYVCFSWDITKDALGGYFIWAAAGGAMLLTVVAISLRRICRGQTKPSDLISLWACCSLLSFTAVFSFTRLTIRHSNYSGISSYYWWFFSFFYMIVVKSLIDEGLKENFWLEWKKGTRFVGYVLIAVFIVAQIGTARGPIEKNYDLIFAKQVQQFIRAGKVYFTANPNACLDTDIVTVPQRNLQVFTMPYYLSKYNCGWVSGTSKTHPVRNNEGITTFQPGPYPK